MANGCESLFICVIFTSFYARVTSYYCDNDKCLEEEFCCGENICCVSYKVWELWYFWCGLLFFLFLLSLCACFWRQRQRAYWVFHSPTYRQLNPEEQDNYIPTHGNPYNLERFPSPACYDQIQKQTWYSPHPASGKPILEYNDTDPMYDTRPAGRKPDY